MSATPLLKKILADPRLQKNPYGGQPCATCAARARGRIEKECAAFNQARRSGITTISWTRYLQAVLPKLKSPVRHPAVVQHLRKCLGWTLH